MTCVHRRRIPTLGLIMLLTVTGLSLFSPGVSAASAESCSDVAVVFARGTNETPGIGYVGEDFTEKLQQKLPKKTLTISAVDYPALYNAPSVGVGGNNMSEQVQSLARNCPATKIVVGGFSQGAVVVDLVTVSPLPTDPIELPLLGHVSLQDTGFDSSLPPDVVRHIAAVVVFGNPATRVYDTQLPMFEGLRARTTELCADRDPVCNPPQPDDLTNYPNHDSYIARELTDKAADSVSALLQPTKARHSAQTSLLRNDDTTQKTFPAPPAVQAFPSALQWNNSVSHD